MPQESNAARGRRFAQDLRKIREARGASLHDLHDETKIPLALIQAFEDQALLDHPQFNRVYLRSFVRTYAQVVGIEPEVALGHLEEALEGRYDGALLRDYLGEGAAPDPKGDTPAQEADPAEDEELEVEEAAAAAPPAPPASADALDDDDEPAPQERKKAFVSTTGAAADTDWTSQSPPGPPRASTSEPARSRRPSKAGGGVPTWVYAAVGVVVLGGIVWLIASLMGGGESEPAPMVADTTAVVDTTVAAPSQAAPQPVAALGDTMRVYVVAAQGKLQGFRVTVDNDLRRPYWLEAGDSMAFRPTNRVIIEEQLDPMRVTLEGRAYPTSRRDEQGRIVITRDTAQAFLQELAAQQ